MAKLIAVVNDYPDFLALMQDLLSEDGYRVATAYEEGRVTAKLRELHPDLLVLDLVLEQGDSGWEILEEVRRDPELATTPVILCTADTFSVKARAADLRRHLDVSVLAKPFHIADMRALVRRLAGPADDARR